MDPEFTIDQVDVNGDIRETAHEAIDTLESRGDTRLDFLKKAGLAGGAVMGGGALLTALTPAGAMAAGTGRPPASFGKGDVGILNYALTLEYLETAFYADVVKSGLFKGADLETIRKFGAEEAEHVDALTAAVKQLGGKPAPRPKTEFPLESAKSVLELAGTVENLGAAAYLGQAGNIQSPEVLASALAIHSVEGRHASALNTLLGKPITPDGAFAKPATAKVVLKSVEPFIVG
jgi:rubrerythrin